MKQERDFASTTNCLCFHLRYISRMMTQFFDAEMRRHGIRTTQGTILVALRSHGPANMADLSEGLGVDRTTLVRNLQPLERDGLISSTGGGRGGRVELEITAKGIAQIEKLAPAWEKAQSAAVEILGAKRWTTILSDLEKVGQALSKGA